MSYQTSLIAEDIGQEFERLVERFEGECRGAEGRGAPKRSWVYFVARKDHFGAVKIGVSGGTPDARLRELQTGCPEPLELLAHFRGSAPHEEILHYVLVPHWLRGEWFRLDRDIDAFISELKSGGLAFAIGGYRQARCRADPSYYGGEHWTFLTKVVPMLYEKYPFIATGWGR